MSQIMKLYKSWDNYRYFFVTTSQAIVEKLKEYNGDVYIINECNRQYPLRLIKALFSCIKIVFREKPNVVISTGAAPGLLVCLAGRLLGAKIIWVDSIANAEKLSLSGQIIRPFADLFFSQWPEIARQYKNVEYVGTLI